MLTQHLFLAFVLSALGSADVDNNDIPGQCVAICSPVVALSQSCDALNDDNDRSYLNCVCNAAGADVAVPVCEACVAQFDSDRRDNDVNDLIRSCSFTTTTFNPSATPSSVSLGIPTLSNSRVAPTSGVTSASAPTATTSLSASQTTATVAGQSPGAAAALGAPAGLALGALGAVLGMM